MRIETPLGTCILSACAEGLTRVGLCEAPEIAAIGPMDSGARAHLDAAAAALEEYFGGARKSFDDLDLAPKGSDFQLRVWAALQAIPFGQTQSYGELAHRIGSPGGARAVGMANRRNPIGIIIPCHRVIGSNGSLVGYAGGIDNKRRLLAHEGSLAGDLFSDALTSP